jgi:hypothetical protein
VSRHPVPVYPSICLKLEPRPDACSGNSCWPAGRLHRR